jgi:hypothetical protein
LISLFYTALNTALQLTAVVGRLPETALAFYQHTLARSIALAPLIAKAHQAGCHVEAITLSHGLIQFALRGLYVLAWQRAVLPRALTESELAPYYTQGSRRGDVLSLIRTLEENGVLFDFHAAHLRNVNEVRNRAAHGVIFGEIAPASLNEQSEKAQHAALGALETLRVWFNNPRALKEMIGR